MKNIRKFETTAEMESAVLAEPYVLYNEETGLVYTNPNGGSNDNEVDYSAEYLTLEALEDGTFSFTKEGSGDDIQYSKDNGATWMPLASGETVSVVTGDKVMWKSTITPNSGIGIFSSSYKFNVCGNIMSLLYADDFNEQTSLEGKDYVFCYLFSNCKYLIDVSNLILPATTLAKYCYYGMFQSCSSLTTSPELPATTLAEKCYCNMFQNCTSLTTSPELPATTLAEYCYQYMFKSSTSLTTAPELPATTLAEGCCYGMFEYCSGLTTAPSILPATTLANSCYSSMFKDCRNLTTAPELPATILDYYCYYFMFSNCTSLTTAPELPATDLADNCYASMFKGCTNLTTAPELPATTLNRYCYDSMFQKCTSLTTAPELPATTLVYRCYQFMFTNCKNLTHITMLATYSDSGCLTSWVDGVSSTGTFVKHPDMTTLPTGSSGIPNGWTVEDAVI